MNKRLKYLLEYTVKSDPYSNSNIPSKKVVMSEDDPTPETPPMEEPTDISMDSKPESESDVVDMKIDKLKEVATIHSDEISKIFYGMEVMVKELDALKNSILSVEDVNNMQQKMIDELTPPTPEESLDHMVKVTGGFTSTDYWREYLKKHGGYELEGNIPDINSQSNIPAKITLPKYSENEIKSSIGF